MVSLSERLTDYLVLNGSIREEDKDLYAFGIGQGLFIALNTATTFLISLYFGMVWQGGLFLICYFSLRSYSGGYHASTPARCYLVSTAITVLFFLLLKYSPDWPPIIMLSSGIIAMTVTVLLAPLESINKPLDALERKTYKRRSMAVLSVQSGVGFLLYALAQKTAASVVLLSITFVGAMLLIAKFTAKEQGA